MLLLNQMILPYSSITLREKHRDWFCSNNESRCRLQTTRLRKPKKCCRRPTSTLFAWHKAGNSVYNENIQCLLISNIFLAKLEGRPSVTSLLFLSICGINQSSRVHWVSSLSRHTYRTDPSSHPQLSSLKHINHPSYQEHRYTIILCLVGCKLGEKNNINSGANFDIQCC